MRRTLVVSMALFAVVNAPAAAQTCLGLASHSAGQMQVAGNAQFTDISNSFGASFGYGQPAGMFANAHLGHDLVRWPRRLALRTSAPRSATS